MFLNEGVRQVKMDDIARALSISKRTLYEIYVNKELLLLDVIKELESSHERQLKEYASNGADTMEIIVEVYRLQMKELGEVNPHFFEDLHAYDSLSEYLRLEHEKHGIENRKFIEEAIREGYFLGDLNYDVIYSILDASSSYILNADMFRKYGLKTVFHNFTMVFLRGICTEKGVKRLGELMQKIKGL